MTPNDIHAPVSEDFARVNDLIFAQLTSRVPLVEKIGHYIVSSGGKRLRPLLVLLTSRALAYPGEDHLKLAAVIEFLHTATLLHDDVVDTSHLRRGKPTANANWGNAPSVLVGDYLYSRAFQMMVSLDSMAVMDVLSAATAVIAEGEVLQLMNAKNPDLDEAQYMSVIQSKTAMLFQAASHSAALLGSTEEAVVCAMRDYGLHLGLAFQLVDDVLDYSGNASEMGKNVGDDLAEGKSTLPLIQAMKVCDEQDRLLIRQAIRKGGLDDLDRICGIVSASGALDYTLELAREQATLAAQCTQLLPDSPAKGALLSLTELAVSRSV
jgi:octaprenyl-diphosphate synthase